MLITRITTAVHLWRQPIIRSRYFKRAFAFTSRVLTTNQMAEQLLSVTKFREYLRINTVQPDPDYGPAIAFLKDYAGELGLPWKTFECVPKKPIIVITWAGRDPTLKSLLLNSHIDVVPVFPEMWTHDPFGAEKTADGNIYARGAQDMKCVGIQYLEAIRELKQSGETPLRTIHVSFVPDEEIGGADGMQAFIATEHFRQLNVGFALDEGMPNPGSIYRVFYAERSRFWCNIQCVGNPGHGSQFIQNTAGEKVSKVLQEVFALREREENRLKADPSLFVGDVITINLTILKGGVQHNVVPATFEIGLDIRIPPTVKPEDLEQQILQWCAAAGSDVTLHFVNKSRATAVTPTTSDDPWWSAFESGCNSSGITIQKEIFPAGTDSRYLREIGIPALGFSPMNNTPILLHDHDEYLNEGVFVRGIKIYVPIIQALANVKN